MVEYRYSGDKVSVVLGSRQIQQLEIYLFGCHYSDKYNTHHYQNRCFQGLCTPVWSPVTDSIPLTEPRIRQALHRRMVDERSLKEKIIRSGIQISKYFPFPE